MAATPSPKGSIIQVNDLRVAARIFSKNWYILVVALVLSAVLAFLYSYKIPEVYGARTQILLKDRTAYDYQSQMYKGLGYISAYGDIVNQKRVLTSYDLIDRTLDKLDFGVSYYIIGRFKTTQLYNNLPFKVEIELLNPRLYERPFDLHIIDPKTFSINYDPGQGVVTKEFSFNQDIADPDFVLKVIPTSDLKASTLARYAASDYRFIPHSRARQISKYAQSMQVTNIDYTSILVISVEDEIADRAKLFLDTLSKEYINYTLQGDFDINENTLLYIDKQLDEVTGILGEYEDELQEFLLSKDIIDLNKESNMYFNQLVNLDADKRRHELMIESVDNLRNYVINIGDDELLPPSFYILGDDAFLKSTLNRLYNMQMDINRYSYALEPENPTVVELKETIQLTRGNLLIYLKNTRQAIEEKIADIEKQSQEYLGLIRAVPQNQRDVEVYKRKVAVNEKLYQFLLEKRASTVIARAGIVPQTKVIEVARSMGVVKPDKTKILYTFLVGGGLAAMLLVFVRVLFYDRVDNADQLRSITQIPVFGEVIASEKAEDNYVVVDSDPKAGITESFRTIRTNLEYLPAMDTGRVVLVTSYRPNEGKTFCSVNLGTILAKAGKRVLLLELDLHKPKVGKGLDMKAKTGLSSVLVGKAPMEENILPTRFENLHVMLAGATPPNASELILSKKLIEVFEYGRQHYDYVFVDTPPVGLITDALLMMRHVDATLFVINTRFANRDHVRNAIDVHDSTPVKNFGFILNGVRMKKSKYYYNTNYGYGYRYAYGYGGYGGYGYGYGRSRKKKDQGADETPNQEA